ncbi:MAG: hypothetical protein GF334_04495 [Candidatus Altiarchaeales archaeon]|nr:hypothetical protein [Candidatus Altiarchaeales archaeon]
MNREEDYTPSGFTRKDYQRLAEINNKRPPEEYVWGLHNMLIAASWRDKRIQRILREGQDRVSWEVLMCPLEDVPMYLGSKGIARQLPSLIAAWRLELGK